MNATNRREPANSTEQRLRLKATLSHWRAENHYRPTVSAKHPVRSQKRNKNNTHKRSFIIYLTKLSARQFRQELVSALYHVAKSTRSQLSSAAIFKSLSSMLKKSSESVMLLSQLLMMLLFMLLLSLLLMLRPAAPQCRDS